MMRHCKQMLFFGGVLLFGAQAQAGLLINGLGGDAGFGEHSLAVGDDNSQEVDISGIFENGLNLCGSSYSSLYINNNGNITFGSALSSYSPTAIRETEIPMIAPFWADVDTRGGSLAASSGGNSTGANTVWYDIDAENGVFTVTWDDVGAFSSGTVPNAFQLQLINQSGNEDRADGDFDIRFIYEDIQWTMGSASSVHASMGWTSGDGSNWFEAPQSGDADALLGLGDAETSFYWEVRGGTVIPEPGSLALIAVSSTILFGFRRRFRS